MDKIRANIVNTVVDNIIDAQMQLDYARDAKEAGNQAMAKTHLEEANRRLAMVDEWKKKMDMSQKDGELAEILWRRYDDWASNIRRCVAECKM